MNTPRYLAITGGIGGAKLSLGLASILGPDALAFVVNTGDDFEHLGLHISPDIDTLVYTLSGEVDTETGWGCRDESWQFMAMLDALGGETWFQLGDRDMAMHVERSRRLAEGQGLAQVTKELAGRLGVAHRILPVSDDPVRTRVQTTAGWLDFQHYFVRDRCEPAVTGFEFAGAESARLNPDIAAWLESEALRGVILCPSNPFVSIDPMLAVPGLRDRLCACPAPVVAVSPVVGGDAIKGPTVKMMRELGVPNSASQVASHYRDFLDGFVLDSVDVALAGEIESLRMAVMHTHTVMVSLEDRTGLARAVVDFVDRLG